MWMHLTVSVMPTLPSLRQAAQRSEYVLLNIRSRQLGKMLYVSRRLFSFRSTFLIHQLAAFGIYVGNIVLKVEWYTGTSARDNIFFHARP